jgi:hypothetical protein
MVKEPAEGTLGRSFYACYNSPYTDFLVANFAANARLIGLDGVRFDTIAPQGECNSLYHGCGWTDENGKLWGSINMFATREFFKRIYRVFHGGANKEGIVYLPVAGPPCMAFDSFVDTHEIGEGSFEKGLTLKDGYPQGDVRVRMVGTAYGFVTSNNLKGQPLTTNERIAALVVAGADPRCSGAGNPAMHYRGYQKLSSWFPNPLEIWDAWKWIDRGRTSIWMPYWENKEYLKLQAPKLTSEAEPEMYSSFHYQPGKRVLLIVTSYEQEPLAGVTVSLDLAKLGFAPDAKLFAEDAITQEPVELTGGTVKVDLFAQRFRMVKISADAPKYADANLGPNLFAAGAFENFPEGATVTAIAEQTEPTAAADTSVSHGGKASVRLQKVQPDVGKRGAVSLAPVNLEPGKYLFSGYVMLKEDLKPPMENKTNPRPDHATLGIGLEGPGLTFDPPREFSQSGGAFAIAERTPGWFRFILPVEAGPEGKTLTCTIVQSGLGTVWLDDLQLQKLNAP